MRKPRKYDEAKNGGQYRKYTQWELLWPSDFGHTLALSCTGTRARGERGTVKSYGVQELKQNQ